MKVKAYLVCWFSIKVTKHRGQITSERKVYVISVSEISVCPEGLAELGSSFQVDRNHRVHLGRWTSVFPSGLLHSQPKGVTLVSNESSFFR